MFSPETSARNQLTALESALGLTCEDQDWGIVNADPLRVVEFVRFFERHYDEHWSPSTVAEFVDLVMESASSAIRADPDFPVKCIDQFVAVAAPVAPRQFSYWTSRQWTLRPRG